MTDTKALPILVADSDVSTRCEIAYALRDAGFKTVQAACGGRALEFAEHVSAMLLDVDLPGVNGLEVCRILRAQPGTAGMPVIHMSGADGDEHRIAATQAGANAFIHSPVAHDILTEVVVGLLHASPAR